jgi:hypothetical protein
MDLLGKRLGDIKHNLIFHNVVTSPAELVRHRFDSHNRMALGFLFLIEAFDPRIKADRKIGGLHKCPGQTLVAVSGIAASFTFAVADFLTPHTSTIRSVISYTGKSSVRVWGRTEPTA